MSNIILKAEVRDNTGTGNSRELRRQGKVPCIIYGEGKPAVSVVLDKVALTKQIQRASFKSRIITIEAGKEKFDVLPRDIQVDPIKGWPLHADFYAVPAGKPVNVWVRVKFIDDELSPGLKRGGVLNVVRREIEVTALPENVPAFLIASLKGLAVKDSVHSHSLDYPEGVTPVMDRDFTVASIAGRAKKEETVDVAADASAEVPTVGDEEAAEGAEE